MPKEIKNIINKLPDELQKSLMASIFHESLLEDNYSGYLFLVFLEYLTFVTSFYKVRATGSPIISKTGNPPSMFTMSFMPSGARKDFGLSLIEEKIFKDLFTEIKNTIEIKSEYLKSQLEKEAYDRYPNNDDKSGMYRQQYLEKLEEKYLRRPNIKHSNSTMEGIHADRQAYQKMGSGASFYFVKEISSYYTRHSETKASLDAYLLESSETGDTTGKSIKSDREISEIKGVPVSVHMHGTIEADSLPKALQNFLKEGAARRIFIYFASKTKSIKKFKDMTDEEIEKYVIDQESREKPKFKSIKKLINNILPEILIGDKKLKISKEVNISYKVESIKLRRQKIDISYKAHMADIPWRALKIATPLQLLINPKSKTLDLSTYKIALLITKYYAKFYKKLLNFNDESVEEKAIKLIQDKGTITFSTLKKLLKNELKNNINDLKLKEDILATAADLGIEIQISNNNRGFSFTVKS